MNIQPLYKSKEINNDIDVRVEEAKLYLKRLVSENMSETDNGAIAIALLEMAVDRFIQRYGPQSASSFIATIFRKTLNNHHALTVDHEVVTMSARQFN